MGLPLPKTSEEKMIFVDSNAFIAVRVTNHPLHGKALSISQHLIQEREELTTSNIVISEVFTILAMKFDKKLALQFGEEIHKKALSIIYIDNFYHQKAWQIFQKVKDKDVSFFDCTSFAVMESLGIKKVFSFDVDFSEYGFEVVKS